MPCAPLVSVIIPTYNRRKMLQEAITSVLIQTYTHLELLVVDDGSNDGTEAMVKAYTDPRITYIFQPHQGVSRARNRGILTAQGTYIAFLDSDDLWLPDKLARQLTLLQHEPEIPLVHTEEIWVRNGRRVNPQKKHQKAGGEIFDKALPRCIISPSAALIRRELFAEIGLFDEALPACEDYDLWLRVTARYPVAFLPEPLIIKRGGHNDQLSRCYLGMDRFRIASLVKLLSSTPLSPHQFRLAHAELTRKCRIYGTGCLKRGRRAEGEYYLHLPSRIEPLYPTCFSVPDSVHNRIVTEFLHPRSGHASP